MDQTLLTTVLLKKSLGAQLVFTSLFFGLLYFVEGVRCPIMSIGVSVWLLINLIGVIAARKQKPCLLFFSGIVASIVNGILIGVLFYGIFNGYYKLLNSAIRFVLFGIFLLMIIVQGRISRLSIFLARLLKCGGEDGCGQKEECELRSVEQSDCSSDQENPTPMTTNYPQPIIYVIPSPMQSNGQSYYSIYPNQIYSNIPQQ